jgi:C4-dicarboxylate transporter DctQ subunit
MDNLGRRLATRTARLIDGWSELSGYLCGLVVLAATVVIVDLVITRYMRIPTVWQEELARYLIILSVFIGAAYTQKHDGHISIDLLTVYISPRPREVVSIIGAALGIVVATIIAWYAWPLWWDYTSHGYHSESLWGPPLAFPYILLPLGMTFLILQYFVYIARMITRFRKGGTEPGSKTEA